MYSQNDEEKVILGVFGEKPGRLLDIGAYDGKAFSNTLALIELGWEAVCIEPSPGVFNALMERHKSNPKVTLVNCAIAPKAGLMPFYDSGGDAVSTLDTAHKEKWEKGWNSKFTPLWTNAITMEMLFAQFGYDYDFINLDVEGISYLLSTQLPYDKISKARVICIEHDGHDNEICVQAGRVGFQSIYFNGENIILSR